MAFSASARALTAGTGTGSGTGALTDMETHLGPHQIADSVPQLVDDTAPQTVVANGEQADPSDDGMSEASPDEVAARQAELNLAAEEFLRAEDTGVVDADGQALYADGTWRPVGYDSTAASSAGPPAGSARPLTPVVTEHHRIDTPPPEEALTPKRRRALNADDIVLDESVPTQDSSGSWTQVAIEKTRSRPPTPPMPSPRSPRTVKKDLNKRLVTPSPRSPRAAAVTGVPMEAAPSEALVNPGRTW